MNSKAAECHKLASQVIEKKTLLLSAFQQQGHLGEPACPQAPWDWATPSPSATRLPLHPEVQRNCQHTEYVKQTL